PCGAAPLYYLGGTQALGANDTSMLLSFERPASAGGHVDTSNDVTDIRVPGRRTRLSTVLENCTDATSAAIDKRRLKNGYHRALHDLRVALGQITVKIVRAHGGCLGTKSR